MLFSKANWCVFGLDVVSGDLNPAIRFANTLRDRNLMFNYSQLVASVCANFVKGTSFYGINPYECPRMDENLPGNLRESVYKRYITCKNSDDELDTVYKYHHEGEELDLSAKAFFGWDPRSFMLDKGMSIFGLWAVSNTWKDVTDVKSKQENVSYQQWGKPYKLTLVEEKKTVDQVVACEAITVRTQFPMIVDFSKGLMYIATTNKECIAWVKDFMSAMGCPLCSTSWEFGSSDWYNTFLNRLYTDSDYITQIEERCKELEWHLPEAIEKLEDKSVERIVSRFFAQTCILGSEWVGLAPNAGVTLSKVGASVGCPTTAETRKLMGISELSALSSCKLIFQEQTHKMSKTGEVSKFADIFALDITDKLYHDAGAIILKGFDQIESRQIMKSRLKKQPDTPIADSWNMWTYRMHDHIRAFEGYVRTMLGLDKGGLLVHLDKEDPNSQIVTPMEQLPIVSVTKGSSQCLAPACPEMENCISNIPCVLKREESGTMLVVDAVAKVLKHQFSESPVGDFDEDDSEEEIA